MTDDYNEKIAPPRENKASGVLGIGDGSHIKSDIRDQEGVMDQGRGDSYGVAVSKDGLKSHPQPTADPLDPLNWTSVRKHTILAIVMYL